MSLHPAPILDPPPPLCPHGRHVTRTCDQCNPALQFYGNDRLIYEFVSIFGLDELACYNCASANWRRNVQEVWEKMEGVDFKDVTHEEPSAACDVSSAEYLDEHDTERWECAECGSALGNSNRRDLFNLLTDLDKEPY